MKEASLDHVVNDFGSESDLVIVSGSSLLVHPSCDFLKLVRDDTPRLMINMEVAGTLSAHISAFANDQKISYAAALNHPDIGIHPGLDFGSSQDTFLKVRRCIQKMYLK